MVKRALRKIQEIKPLKEIKKTQEEFRKTTITLILGGFGLVAALAWNEAIRSFFDIFFPKGSSGLIGKFIYAFIVTIIVVIVSLQLRKISEKKEE